MRDAQEQSIASLGPITDQQNRLAVAEIDFKEQFEAYVVDQASGCTFTRVLEGVVSLVSFAAEAVSGVGEIAAIGEAESIAEVAAGVVKLIKTVEAEVKEIQEAVESVRAQMELDPDAAKFLVDETTFDEFIDQYLGKFPAATELAAAVHQYFALIQVHNKVALAYTGLFVKRARIQATVDSDHARVEAIAATRAVVTAEDVLPAQTAFMTSAYWSVKAEVLRELYEFNRAYTYWSLVERPFFSADTTIADLALAYAEWSKDIDTFLEQSGPVQPFRQQIVISAAEFPEAFTLLAQTRKLHVQLDLATIAPKFFGGMTHVVATTVAVKLPDVHATTGAVLIELTHGGLAQQNSSADLGPAAVHTFSHARRTIPFKIDYGNPANTAGGLIGDAQQGFPGLSPFAMWEISFAAPGNEWLDVSVIRSVQLDIAGTFLLGQAPTASS